MSDEPTNAELARAIGRIESEMASGFARLERKMDEVTGDHEKRLRALERWMWTCIGLSLTGALSGITAFFGGGA